jgi:hypothetical protein
MNGLIPNGQTHTLKMTLFQKESIGPKTMPGTSKTQTLQHKQSDEATLKIQKLGALFAS